MQIVLIETFLDLMETRNFNRTAERLNITQSTVTHRINALEAIFARKLFARNKGGTQPTAAGLRFLDHAKALQHQWHEASRAVETAGAYERSMRIGLQHDLAAHYAGDWLTAVRKELPATSIYLEVDYSNQMNRDLGAGALDLAILFTPHYLPDLHYERIGEVHYEMVSNKVTRLEDVRPEDYIQAVYSPAFDRLHRQAYPHLSTAPIASGETTAIIALMTKLGGSAFVIEPDARRLLRTGAVNRVAGADPIWQTVYAAVNVRTRHAHQHRRITSLMQTLLNG
ncbi:DNA-binding transcriptional LysR family regulator [Mycoplana sp. BE70]|uniref:LysR family transcriptional regulator n=1 Tax=Mycoplana sp. BE70 TaxID=2817775 RepID=UPI00285F4A7F|nr:LysR family transcriptional regulator [Mycoplana sp. BE70]MDR6756735.1 DNA-binding transcriptional LysR family regulator [Mycoplana sp. BE70]